MKSICPECQTANPVMNLYCANCGASMLGAEVVKAVEPPPSQAEPKKKQQRWSLIIVAIVALFVLGAILVVLLGPRSDRTDRAPDLVATQVAVERAAAATLTAEAPAATHTAESTDAPAPSDTPRPTGTRSATSMPALTSAPATFWTLDGYDKDAGITVQTINLWKDYIDRSAGVAATGRHGERVKLIRRSGDGVLIELNSGKQGWVTYYFIEQHNSATSAPTRTATATPTERPTDTPTPLPTSTAVPVVVPDGWRTYQHFSGKFHVAYPAKWTVEDEGPSSVYFDVPNYAGFSVGVYKAECGIDFEHDPGEAKQCLAVHEADQASSLDTFRLVSSDTWDDDLHKGYVVEYVEQDYAYDSWSYHVAVFIPKPGKPRGMIGATYYRVGTKSITDQERNQLHDVMGLLRLGVARPGVQTAPTETTKAVATTTAAENTPPTQQTEIPVQIVSSTGFTDIFGYYQVHGEVENNSNENMRHVKIVGRFYNVDGELVADDWIYQNIYVFESGTVSPFDFWVRRAPEPIDSYELEIAEYETTESAQLRIAIVREKEKVDGSRREIYGEVRNPYDFPVGYVVVNATYYDADGQVLRVGSDSTDIGTLQPGQTSAFQIVLTDVPGGLDHYTLQTETERSDE